MSTGIQHTEDIEVDGLVVREAKVGEADKVITLLTDKLGKITISGKGVKSLKNRYAASTELFTYSTFLLRKKGSFYYIRDAFYIESFISLRYDLERLSLANYICDVAADMSNEELADLPLLRLTLNTLYALANRDELPMRMIKGAFEFRAAVIEGFMPDLSVCGECSSPLEGEVTIDVMNGRMLCRACRHRIEFDREYAESAEYSAKIHIRVTPAVLSALRYIEQAEEKRFLAFTIDEDELALFEVVCERYLLNHIEHGFSSLEYYKKIVRYK